MSPLYEYVCQNGHTTTALRAFRERANPLGCDECGGIMDPVISLPAKRTDGIYSYAPNIGNPDKHERWQHDIAKKREKP